MRISDWSSDVCSSDLDRPACRRRMLSAAVSRARRICCPALCAPVAKVTDVMALRAGLGFVARFRPAAGAGKALLPGLHLPFALVTVAAHHHQPVVEIGRATDRGRGCPAVKVSLVSGT